MASAAGGNQDSPPQSGNKGDRTTSSQDTPLGFEDDEVEDDEEELDGSKALITEIKIETPEWLDAFMAASGISSFFFLMRQERAKRADVSFTNPNPEIYWLVMSMSFEVVVAFVILLNCAQIGWQASLPPEQQETVIFLVCEHGFCAFFLIEWILRVIAFGWVWIFELTNFMDTIIVFGIGIIPRWLLIPIGYQLDFLKIFTVLRTLRLARLVKAIRTSPTFKELWILTNGILTSLTPMLWTSIMGIAIMYVFAVAGVQLIGHHSDFEDDEEVQELFGDTVRSMFTMFQLMTMDEWAERVARPVMKKQYSLFIFFFSYMSVAVFIFWNLITAIIVENAMNIARADTLQRAKDQEQDKRRELKALADIFLEIDEDGSGELSHEEFFGSLNNPKVIQILTILDVNVDDLEDLWKVLDDGDNSLTIKEFAGGIRRMKGSAKAKDSYDIVKRLRQTSNSLNSLRDKVSKLGGTLLTVEEDVKRMSRDSGEILGLFHEMYHRLQASVERGQREDYVDRLKAARAAKLAAAETAGAAAASNNRAR